MTRRFPTTRMRRMRADKFSRHLMREHQLTPNDLIYPVFVIEGERQTEAIASMPGISRQSIDLLAKEALHLNALGRENLSQADAESLLRASFETAMVQHTQFGQCFMELEKNCARRCCGDVLIA